MPDAAIAIGSNLEPASNVPAALHRIAEIAEISAVSAIYASPALGPDGRPDGNPEFHNAVVLVRTDLGPLSLRGKLRDIEADLGRHRTSDRYAPRPIDLDIVFYASVIIETDSVAIPDPGALDLAHIAVPLSDVAPDWRPPGGATTAAEAAAGHGLTVLG